MRSFAAKLRETMFFRLASESGKAPLNILEERSSVLRFIRAPIPGGIDP